MKVRFIKEVRESKHMSQKDVVEKAKKLGGLFSQAQLSSWELLKSEPSEKNIEILCKVLECEVNDLECEVNDLSINLATNKKKIANISYNFGKKFKPQELKNMYREISACTDITKKSQVFVQNILEIATIKAVPVPLIISEIFSAKDEVALNNFLVNFWNGSVENNSK